MPQKAKLKSKRYKGYSRTYEPEEDIVSLEKSNGNQQHYSLKNY